MKVSIRVVFDDADHKYGGVLPELLIKLIRNRSINYRFFAVCLIVMKVSIRTVFDDANHDYGRVLSELLIN